MTRRFRNYNENSIIEIKIFITHLMKISRQKTLNANLLSICKFYLVTKNLLNLKINFQLIV
jgi:hypothetical protein